MVPDSILWFRLQFCGSGFHFADLASLLQVCLPFFDVLLDLDRLLASQETCALVAIGQVKQGSARVFWVHYGVRTSRVFYQQRVYLTNVLSAEEVRRVSFVNTSKVATPTKR